MQQYQKMIETIPSHAQYPRSTNKDGSIHLVSSDDWTSGFFPGSLWYLFKYSNKSTLLESASSFTSALEKEKNNTGTHDVGFMMGCSYGNGYLLTDDADYENILMVSANSLASRFNPSIGCLRSWDGGPWNYPVIIDNMMNLELLFLASKISHNQSYKEKAISHANVTMANHFRADYSSFHVVDYANSGAVISKTTHQGFSDQSAWARGQSWALYGYTMCYRYTKDIKYLQQAEKIALFIINNKNFPADKVPYWDYNAPTIPNAPRDVASASIMCSALFELSKYSKDYSDKFLNIAIEQVNTLASEKYTASIGTNNHFILMHGTGNFPGNSEIDSPLNYADYYYLEALIRYRSLLNHSPNVDFTYKVNESTLNLKIDFDASITTDIDADSLVYNWDFGDGKKAYSLSHLASHIYSTPGTYAVKLKSSDKWGGLDSISQKIEVKLPVNVLQTEDQNIKVYPNPTSKGFNVELPNNYLPATLSIFNMLGHKSFLELYTCNHWVQTEGWDAGLYVLHFKSRAGINQVKLMVRNM